MQYKKCDPILNENYIHRILAYLQGWELKKPHQDEIPEEYATSFLEHDEIKDALETIQTITKHEIALFFDMAKNDVKSYIWYDYIPNKPQVHEALCKWTAGLIWKKYNVKEVEFMDSTNQLGYGDQLIQQAKYTLNPHIRTRLRSVL